MKKPILSNAKIVEETTIESLIHAGLSESVAKFIIERQGKEYGGDVGVYAKYLVVGDCSSSDYIAVKTRGASDTLSMFRLVGGCNNIEAFDIDGAEKSADYDSLPDSAICYFSDSFEKAKENLLSKYMGKTLRIVARSAEGLAPFGGRYYIFSVDNN